MINESEAVQNCLSSKGVISDETIRAHHPWVVDTAKEKRQVDAEHQEELAEMTAFSNDDAGNKEGNEFAKSRTE